MQEKPLGGVIRQIRKSKRATEKGVSMKVRFALSVTSLLLVFAKEESDAHVASESTCKTFSVGGQSEESLLSPVARALGTPLSIVKGT